MSSLCRRRLGGTGEQTWEKEQDRAQAILFEEGLTHELASLLIDRVEVSEKDRQTKQQEIAIS